jgi:excisionase family DNA binding protein
VCLPLRPDALQDARRPPPGSALLTIPEAAYVLRVSTGVVDRLIRTGALPCTRVSSRRLVPRHDLDAFVERQTTTSRPEALEGRPGRLDLIDSGLWNGKPY